MDQDPFPACFPSCVPYLQLSFLSGAKSVSAAPARVAFSAAAPSKLAVRAAVGTKESKKDEEGVQINLFKPKTPYIGRCLLNTKIVGDDAPGETNHMVFSTEGKQRCQQSASR